jgi:hypothetical protein
VRHSQFRCLSNLPAQRRIDPRHLGDPRRHRGTVPEADGIVLECGRQRRLTLGPDPGSRPIMDRGQGVGGDARVTVDVVEVLEELGAERPCVLNRAESVGERSALPPDRCGRSRPILGATQDVVRASSIIMSRSSAPGSARASIVKRYLLWCWPSWSPDSRHGYFVHRSRISDSGLALIVPLTFSTAHSHFSDGLPHRVDCGCGRLHLCGTGGHHAFPRRYPAARSGSLARPLQRGPSLYSPSWPQLPLPAPPNRPDSPVRP